MKGKSQQNLLMAMGATLAVCSAVALMGGTKTNKAQKTMKKTADKMMNFVDTVTSLMQQKKPATNVVGFPFINSLLF